MGLGLARSIRRPPAAVPVRTQSRERAHSPTRAVQACISIAHSRARCTQRQDPEADACDGDLHQVRSNKLRRCLQNLILRIAKTTHASVSAISPTENQNSRLESFDF